MQEAQTQEAQLQDPQQVVNDIYQYAANLMVNQKLGYTEMMNALKARGLDEASADVVINNLEAEIGAAKSSAAKKDMLYGALWCVGGTIATVADIGLIFWGAIVFGAIQFFKGLSNL